MADSGAIAFGAAVVGALVGGLGSAAGSAFIKRRELIRSARLRMYDDLLPSFRARAKWRGKMPRPGWGGMLPPEASSPTSTELLASLRRSAVIAGATEAGLVEELRRRWQDLTRPPSTAEGQTDPYGNEVPPERMGEEALVIGAIDALEKHLEDKIR